VYGECEDALCEEEDLYSQRPRVIEGNARREKLLGHVMLLNRFRGPKSQPRNGGKEKGKRVKPFQIQNDFMHCHPLV
jgi:hypothetical protein